MIHLSHDGESTFSNSKWEERTWEDRNVYIILLVNFIRFRITVIKLPFLSSCFFYAKMTFLFCLIFQIYQSRSAADATARQSHVLLYKIRRGSAKADFRRDVSDRRTAQQVVHKDSASDTLVHRGRKMLGAFIL